MRTIKEIWEDLPGRKLRKEEGDDIHNIKELELTIDYPDNKNADFLLSHARDGFAESKMSVESIEKKADDLIKYIGIVTAFFSYIIANASQYLVCSYPTWALWVGFSFWVASLLFVLWVRRPTIYLYPDNICYVYSKMLNQKEFDEYSAKTILMISYEKARISHHYQGRRKAKKLNLAYFAFTISLVSILGFWAFILF